MATKILTPDEEASNVLRAMKRASETVREAMANAIPVASNQVLTIAVPGTIINYKDYAYNVDEHVKPPLDIRVKEARLVDGMIPLSKFTAGRTGKSVARSYLAALDLLVPVEASVSGVLGNQQAPVADPRLKVIQRRYNDAMNWLKSPDDTPGANGRSKVETYVAKQTAWSTAVGDYARAQGENLRITAPGPNATVAQIKESREKYMQWLQEHARDFKESIQAKYMDWVVHGYKFMVDFNFGIVDISSGMKRVENSKEAFRNLTLIAEDGSSEYQGVVLTPSNWATIVKDKVLNWSEKNREPSPSEIKAELRRLQSLLASHKTLKAGVETDSFFPVVAKNTGPDDKGLKNAYIDVYTDIEGKNFASIKGVEASGKREDWAKKAEADPPADGAKQDTNPFNRLLQAQEAYTTASLSRDNAAVRDNQETAKTDATKWLDARIEQLEADIKDLKTYLIQRSQAQNSGLQMALPIVNEKGVVATEEELRADAELTGKKQRAANDDSDDSKKPTADPWTKIACKSSSKTDNKETETFSSASAIAAKAGWGVFSASGGATHTQSSAKAMSQMSNLEVDISMSCMVVDIERPWLHAELFADAELDTGSFLVSPGEEALKEFYNKEKAPGGEYQQFSSFPTAFIVAADVELSFSGDTTALESAVSASSKSANLSVGYGPFSLSASHSRSKTSSKTKMESTATGCKISIQAPQIVGWVQTLLPKLPKQRDGEGTVSIMTGLFG